MFSFFKDINKYAGKFKLLDGLAIFCARALIYLLVLFLFVSAVYYHSRGLFVYSLLSGMAAAFLINSAIYALYKEKRPAEFKTTKTLIPIPSNPSFPSRHAALSFGISFYLFHYNLYLFLFFLICACTIGIARVFCGVHWFKDILGGVVSGLASSIVVYYLVIFIR